LITPCHVAERLPLRNTPAARRFVCGIISSLAFTLTGCRHVPPPASALPTPILAPGALVPSPRLIVGRVVAIDPAHNFAFVELASDAPPAATADGTELIARTLDLRETGRLQASRYVRGHTLGARIVAGQPTPGDEVVWLAP
jgi:hypothetical protein